MQRVEQPWGHEIVFTESSRYAGKILVLEAGRSLPRQYHDLRDWTFFVESGVVQIEVGLPPRVEVIELRGGDSFHVKPGTVYRLRAIQGARLFEVSTPETSDAVHVDPS